MANELNHFVEEALKQGISRPKITQELTRAGWPKEEIRATLDEYIESDLPIPVPKRRPYLSAREAFLYLVMFLTLYISSFSLGSLIFDFINRWVPDIAAPYTFSDASLQTIRQETAALIISYPIFVFLCEILWNAMQRDPQKRQSKIRKWLSYLTLFIGAGIIIGDLIALVGNVLNGELTERFLLKVLTILVITVGIFGYYLWDLRHDE